MVVTTVTGIPLLRTLILSAPTWLIFSDCLLWDDYWFLLCGVVVFLSPYRPVSLLASSVTFCSSYVIERVSIGKSTRSFIDYGIDLVPIF